MEQLFRQLFTNLRFCASDCLNLISPNTARHTLAMCGSLANSTSLLSQLQQQVRNLLRENSNLKAELAKKPQEIEDAQNDGYDLGAQSVLRHQHNIPWKEASELLNAIKKNDKNPLPCALGDTVYVITENYFECHFCQYGKNAPINSDDRNTRKASGGCNSTCPLSVKPYTVESFQILLTSEGFQEIIPCRKHEQAAFGNNRPVPITGIDQRYYLDHAEAEAALKAYAEPRKATCI